VCNVEVILTFMLRLAVRKAPNPLFITKLSVRIWTPFLQRVSIALAMQSAVLAMIDSV